MRVTGRFRYAAPPATMYRLFTDREALLASTPGLVSLSELEPDRYEAVIKVGIGGYALTYQGRLTVTDRVPDEGYRLTMEAETHNGFARGEVTFRFASLDGGRCQVDYEGDLTLGGAQSLGAALARGLGDFFMHGMAEALAERSGVVR